MQVYHGCLLLTNQTHRSFLFPWSYVTLVTRSAQLGENISTKLVCFVGWAVSWPRLVLCQVIFAFLCLLVLTRSFLEYKSLLPNCWPQWLLTGHTYTYAKAIYIYKYNIHAYTYTRACSPHLHTHLHTRLHSHLHLHAVAHTVKARNANTQSSLWLCR